MNPEVGGSSPPSRVPKLYGVGRRDLDPGLRAAQIGHALIEWTLAHGRPPENLVLLEVDDEEELVAIARRVREADVCHHLFREPDLDDAPSALAVGPEGWRLLSSLPLLR